MPGFIARKLCPDLIFVPTNFEKYTYYSELTRKGYIQFSEDIVQLYGIHNWCIFIDTVFQKYDPCFIATSLDEAYINITEICLKRGVSGDEVSFDLNDYR